MKMWVMKMRRIFRAAATLLLAQILLFPTHAAQAQSVTANGVTVSTQGGKTVQINNQNFVVESQVMQVVNGQSTAVNWDVPSNALVTGPVCGAFYNGAKLRECGSQPAVFEGAAIGTCPAGTEFDIGRWSCWTCDKSNGFKRGLAAVDSDRACVRPATAQEKAQKPEFQKAQEVGERCPSGSFYDTIGGGSCWSCPDGYNINRVVHVQAADKCTTGLGREEFKYAELSFRTGDAGQCVNRADGTDRGQLVFWDAHNYGGNGPGCWKCPVSFQRSGHPVYDEHACSRAMVDDKPATQRTGGGCEKGTFTHTYNVDLTGVAKLAGVNERTVCLKCPESYDQVILEAGDSPRKCQTTNSLVFGQATKESALTCQSGQEFDFIGLTQDDINTRPQFKGQPSKPKPVASGTCWSCAEGYYRSVAHVKGGEACGSSGIDYYSGIMRDPGLFGLDGAAEVLAEILAQDAKLPLGKSGMVEQALNKWVDEQGKLKAANKEPFNRDAAMKEEADLLATQPQKSGVAAALVFARVLTALSDEGKATATATAAERKLVASFTQYVKMKRTFVAHMVKRQYDIWLDTVHWREKNDTKKLVLDRATMSAYGRPPSFEQAALLATAGAGALDLAVGTALGAIKIPVPLLGEVTSLAIGLATGGYADYTQGIETALLATTTTAGEMAFGTALTAAVDALVTAAIVHTITAGAITSAGLGLGYSSVAVAGACAASTALASTGIGIGIGAVLIVASMQLEQLNQFLDAPVKVGALVAQAAETRKEDLSRMGKTSGGMTELLTYWSLATGGESEMTSIQNATYKGFGQQHAYMKSYFPVDLNKEFTKGIKGERFTLGNLCGGGMVKDGYCYSCPSGFTRELSDLISDKACSRPKTAAAAPASVAQPAPVDVTSKIGGDKDFAKATKNNLATGLLKTDCPTGQVWNLKDGYCYSCPSGFNRELLIDFGSDKACSRPKTAAAAPASGTATAAAASASVAQPPKLAPPAPQFEIVSQATKSCLVKKGAQAVALSACGAVGDGTSRWMVGPNNTLSPAGFDRMCLTASGAALILTQCNMPSPLGGTMPALPTQMWQLKDGLVISAVSSCLTTVQGNVLATPCNPNQAPQKWTATVVK